MYPLQPELLCQYGYDPLDHLIDHAQPNVASLKRFYCKSRLATEIQGAIQHSIFQHDDQLLAQQRRGGDDCVNALLATDQQRSVLHTVDKNPVPQPTAYSPYGHRRGESGLTSLLGFNGERPDPVTGHYLLGNGYRAFNPVLMRFNSPDSWSPFGAGGLNAYAYCEGDPANRSDKTGHVFDRISTKMDALLKGIATGRVGKTKAISAPRSAVDNAVAGTSAAPKRTNTKKSYVRDLARKREETVRARKLTENESALGPQDHYSVNNDLRELSGDAQTKAYIDAKYGYEFERYPDVDRPYYLPVPNGQGEPVLDVTQWNIAINYFGNRSLVGSGHYSQLHKLVVDRAEYIKKHKAIDLMAIRQ